MVLLDDIVFIADRRTFIFLLRVFFHSKVMAPLSLAVKDRTEVRLCPVAENHGVRFDEAMGHHVSASRMAL